MASTGPTLGLEIPLFSGQGRDHFVAFLGQPALQTLQQLFLVLDHKQAGHRLDSLGGSRVLHMKNSL